MKTGLSQLIWGRAIPNAPTALVNGVEKLYWDLKHDYISFVDWMTCVQTALAALDPCQQESAKKKLTALYASSSDKSFSNQECENFAKAWVHATEARTAVDEGFEDVARAHIDSAYALLVENHKSQRFTKHLDNSAKGRAKGRRECIQEFAELVQAERPARGWRLPTDVATALAERLRSIIKRRSHQYGLLWKQDPAKLIDEWIQKKKGPVYEAYRGRLDIGNDGQVVAT